MPLTQSLEVFTANMRISLQPFNRVWRDPYRPSFIVPDSVISEHHKFAICGIPQLAIDCRDDVVHPAVAELRMAVSILELAPARIFRS